MELETVDKYLNTYAGRDKFLKAICYSLKFATCLTKETDRINKLKIISSELSNCRLILRFLDYIPVINSTRANGLGLSEPDWILRWIGVVNAIIDPIFYPLEQIAWAAERKILKIDEEPWSNASTVCWVLSLYLDLLKCLRNISLSQKHRACLQGLDSNSCAAVEQIVKQQQTLVIMGIRTMCDLTYAIHYLPEGFLWSGKLKTWQVGLLGMMSATISISQALSKMSK